MGASFSRVLKLLGLGAAVLFLTAAKAPKVGELETYVIYVGFDPLSEQPKRAPARKPKPRS